MCVSLISDLSPPPTHPPLSAYIPHHSTHTHTNTHASRTYTHMHMHAQYVTKFDIRMTGISAEYTAAIQSIVVENSQ